MSGSNATNATLAILAGVALTLLQSGCMPDLRSEHPPPRIYWLDPTPVADLPPVSVTVDLVPGLDTDRIWLLEPDQRLNYFAGAFWPDRLQRVLQSLLERSLGAGTDGSDVRVLVERFFAVADAKEGPPTVQLTARIEVDGTRCPFDGRRHAETDRLRDIVAAHQALADELVNAVARTAGSGTCH